MPEKITDELKKDNTKLQAAAAGVMAAYVESWLDYPYIGAKYVLQSGQKISFNPKNLYRGVSAFQASLLPSIMIQSLTNDVFGQYYPAWFVASLGGAIGAIASCPIEKIILTQQINKSGPGEAIRYISSKEGISSYMRGLVPKMIRETGFACSVWYGAAAVNAKLNKMFPGSDNSLISAVISGIPGALLTHPPDVISTIMQQHNIGIKDAVSMIVRREGFKGFFPGFIPRTLSVIGGSYWLPLLHGRFLNNIAASNKLPIDDSESKKSIIDYAVLSRAAVLVSGMAATAGVVNYGLRKLRSPSIAMGTVPVGAQVVIADQALNALVTIYGNRHGLKLVSGFVGGMLTAYITNPAKVVNDHISTVKVSYKQAAKEVLMKKGVGGLYHGAGSAAVSAGIFTAGYYSLAPAVRDLVSKNITFGHTLADAAVAGGLAGGIVSVIAHPFRVIESAQRASGESFASTVRKVISRGGVHTLFKNLPSRAPAMAVPVGALSVVKTMVEETLGFGPARPTV